MGYTLRQLNAYLRLSYQRERRAQRDLLCAVAIGTQGGEPLKNALATLAKD
jgi:hypothetical protein